MVGFLAALPFITAGVQGLGQYFQSRDVAKFQKKFAKDQAKRNAISALSQGRVQLGSPEPQFRQSGLTSALQGLGTVGGLAQQGLAAKSALDTQQLHRVAAQQGIDRIRGAGAAAIDPTGAGVGLGARIQQPQAPISPGAIDSRGIQLRPFKTDPISPVQIDPETAPMPGESPAFNLGRTEQVARQNEVLQRQANVDRSAALAQDQFEATSKYQQGQLDIEELRRQTQLLMSQKEDDVARAAAIQKSRASVTTLIGSNKMVDTNEAIDRALTNAWVGYQMNNAAGDLQMGKALAIFQDPGSTVRESELASIEDIQGLWDKMSLQVKNLFNNDKDRFTKASRHQLMSLMVQSYELRAQSLNGVIEGFITSEIRDNPNSASQEALNRAAVPFRLRPMTDTIPQEVLDTLMARPSESTDSVMFLNANDINKLRIESVSPESDPFYVPPRDPELQSQITEEIVPEEQRLGAEGTLGGALFGDIRHPVGYFRHRSEQKRKETGDPDYSGTAVGAFSSPSSTPTIRPLTSGGNTTTKRNVPINKPIKVQPIGRVGAGQMSFEKEGSFLGAIKPIELESNLPKDVRDALSAVRAAMTEGFPEPSAITMAAREYELDRNTLTKYFRKFRG